MENNSTQTTISSMVNNLMNSTSTNTGAPLGDPMLNFLSGIMSIVGPMIIIGFLMGRQTIPLLFWQAKAKNLLKQYSKLTGRNIIIMNHVSAGLFGSMITMEDAMKIENLIRKFGNTNIDLIINTFGGDLLASIYIAHLLKPNIRVIVPKYAWSGGTFITLGANQILATPKAFFGPVDPQYGTILNTLSAKYWQEIVKRKGDHGVKDDTIAKARMADEIMGEVRNYLEDLIKDKPNINREKFFDLFLEGKYTHAHIIRMGQIKECGLPIEELTTDLPDRILESMKGKNGVFGHRQFKDKTKEDE